MSTTTLRPRTFNVPPVPPVATLSDETLARIGDFRARFDANPDAPRLFPADGQPDASFLDTPHSEVHFPRLRRLSAVVGCSILLLAVGTGLAQGIGALMESGPFGR